MVGFDLFVTGRSHFLLSERSPSFNNVMITMPGANNVMITMPGARWSACIVELPSVLRQQLIKCLAFKRTQHSDSPGSESRTSNPLIPSLTLN